jgi:hypothetical protein
MPTTLLQTNITIMETIARFFRTAGMLAILLLASSAAAQGLMAPGQSWAFVGPMVHFNFGNKEHHISIGLEGSYWKDAFQNQNAPFLGADAGFEYEFGGKWRVYAEAQAGGILGLSAGPVLEIGDGRSRLGMQSSLWYCFILGLDMRWRYTGSSAWSPGIFGKMPLPIQK